MFVVAAMECVISKFAVSLCWLDFLSFVNFFSASRGDVESLFSFLHKNTKFPLFSLQLTIYITKKFSLIIPCRTGKCSAISFLLIYEMHPDLDSFKNLIGRSYSTRNRRSSSNGFKTNELLKDCRSLRLFCTPTKHRPKGNNVKENLFV